MLRVLAPVDGSDHDTKTLTYLSKLFSGRADVEIVLLHAIDLQLLPTSADMSGMPVFLPPSEIDAQQQAARQSAQKIIADAERQARQLNLKTQSEIRWGNPASVIEEFSKESGTYDLIAMGSRGAGQIAGIFLGSVSDRVVHRSHLPVLIIH